MTTKSPAARVADRATARLADLGPFDPTAMHFTLGDLLHLAVSGEHHLVARVLAAWGEAVDDLVPDDENAPAVLHHGEGDDQNTESQQGEPAVPSLPSPTVTVPAWHPLWCDPAACLVDTTDNSHVHRSTLTTFTAGDAHVTTRLLAADDDAPEVDAHLDAEGASLDDLRAALWHLTTTTQRYTDETGCH